MGFYSCLVISLSRNFSLISSHLPLAVPCVHCLPCTSKKDCRPVSSIATSVLSLLLCPNKSSSLHIIQLDKVFSCTVS